MTDKVKVTQAVYDGLEAVRKSGKTNMFDYNQVCVIANMLDFSETVVWLTANKKVYSAGVFRGFEPIEFTDEEATAAIEQAVEASETEAPKGIYPAAKTYAEQHAARASVAKQLPFADYKALDDTEGEQNVDEYGIVEDAFHDAFVAGEYHEMRAMYDGVKVDLDYHKGKHDEVRQSRREVNDQLYEKAQEVNALIVSSELLQAQFDKRANTIGDLVGEVAILQSQLESGRRHWNSEKTRLLAVQEKDAAALVEHAETIEALRQRVAELEADRGDLLELVNDVLSMTNKPEENPVEALSLIWQITHAALKKLEEKS